MDTLETFYLTTLSLGPCTKKTWLIGSVHNSEDSRDQEALSDRRIVTRQKYGIENEETAHRLHLIRVDFVIVEVFMGSFSVNKVVFVSIAPCNFNVICSVSTI